MNPATPPATTISTITVPPSPTASAANSEGRPRSRRRWTEEEKAEHVVRFAGSGLNQAGYCAQAGFNAATFSSWCRRSRPGGAAPAEAVSGLTFAQVCVTAPTAGAVGPAATVVIHLAGGTKLEAAVGADPLWLARLLKALVSA